MEMACDNMVEPGDKVLVFASGIWGQRFAEMVSRHGAYHCCIIYTREAVLVLYDKF